MFNLSKTTYFQDVASDQRRFLQQKKSLEMLRDQEIHKKRMEILEEQLQNERKKNTNGDHIFFLIFTNDFFLQQY